MVRSFTAIPSTRTFPPLAVDPATSTLAPGPSGSYNPVNGPCTAQGLRLVTEEDEHKGDLPRIRHELHLDPSEDMTVALQKLIEMAVGIRRGDAGRKSVQEERNHAKEDNTHIAGTSSATIQYVRVRRATQAKTPYNSTTTKRPQRRKAEVQTPKVKNKGKRKADSDPGSSTEEDDDRGNDLRVASVQVPKRRRTTPVIESLLSGMTCPPDAPILEWTNLGVSTYAPWFSDVDRQTVEYLSRAPRAQDYRYDADRPMLVELAYDGRDAGALWRMTMEIETALSKGCAVLVRGWEPTPALDFTMDSIQMFRPTMMQDVVAQDAIMRAKEQKKGTDAKLYDIHRKLTMKAFIAAGDEEEECLNLLDLPNLQPDVPIFLRPLSDNVNARSATMNDCHLPRKGGNANKNLHGVQVITGDSEKIRGWDLLTHGMFLTYSHHDACGLATYMTVRSGVKIWAIADTTKSTSSSRESLFAEWDKMFMRTMDMKVPNVSLGTVVIRVGDTLIQPPGVNHLALTVQNCLASGGHFLSYSTMHLTELANAFDCSVGEDGIIRGLVSTNAVHPSLNRYVTWMVLGLPVLAQDPKRIFYRRSIIAMITLIENAKSYVSKETKDTILSLQKGDVMGLEMLGEDGAAMKIVSKLKKALDVTDAAKELAKGFTMTGVGGEFGTHSHNPDSNVDSLNSSSALTVFKLHPGLIFRHPGRSLLSLAARHCQQPHPTTHECVESLDASGHVNATRMYFKLRFGTLGE
ncbi:hypothetical protein HD554DRAFT_2043720 [Boletus coccyginus]|nr:hypothetical protein HD554DRAFT_2043720 [Boletus coccyginus]